MCAANAWVHTALNHKPHVQGTAPPERERRFVALLRGGGLRTGAAGAGFGGGWEMQRALSLAQAAGFARGEAQVQDDEDL